MTNDGLQSYRRGPLNGHQQRQSEKNESSEQNFSGILSRFHHDYLDENSMMANTEHHRLKSHYSGVISNESLIDGYSLLRIVQQILNPDIIYLGLTYTQNDSLNNSNNKDKVFPNLSPDESNEANLKQVIAVLPRQTNASNGENATHSNGFVGEREQATTLSNGSTPIRLNIYDEVTSMNPLRKFINSSKLLRALFNLFTISLALMAIMMSVDKTISTILLCIFSRSDIKRQSTMSGKPSMTYEASDVSMSWIVLILVNLSSTYIIFSIVFNGHLLWNLLNQRLFLVSRQFQYKVMLSLLVFVYLEYIVNISFINNLFGWSFVTNDIETNRKHTNENNVHKSYSILSKLENFVTDENEKNALSDVVLTIFQFSRGSIRISPYITINYVMICLGEHIRTIRNQTLLTISLKKKKKLGLVIKNAKGSQNLTYASEASNEMRATGDNQEKFSAKWSSTANGRHKKRVIFATYTQSSSNHNTIDHTPMKHLQLANSSSVLSASQLRSLTPSPISSVYSEGNSSVAFRTINCKAYTTNNDNPEGVHQYYDRIKDFHELESYITNLYIFTGRLNRLMSRQGLAMFFIIHNLIISCSLIVPEAIRGGTPMVYFIRWLVILIGIVPFRCGQYLNGQLEQLSKQIDRIIIHQQFFGRKRDNLVRIRELLHDIRVNCAGMLNFNIETGLKYLVIAFASAFFIEQEDYKLTRRQ